MSINPHIPACTRTNQRRFPALGFNAGQQWAQRNHSKRDIRPASTLQRWIIELKILRSQGISKANWTKGFRDYERHLHRPGTEKGSIALKSWTRTVWTTWTKLTSKSKISLLLSKKNKTTTRKNSKTRDRSKTLFKIELISPLKRNPIIYMIRYLNQVNQEFKSIHPSIIETESRLRTIFSNHLITDNCTTITDEGKKQNQT